MTVCVDESLRFLSELDGYTLLFLFLTFYVPFNHSTHLRMGLFISFTLCKTQYYHFHRYKGYK